MHLATMLALAAVAGLSTSLGPCVAPRYLAMLGIAGNASRSRRLAIIGAFVAGTCLSYVALASFGWLVTSVGRSSRLFYAALAVSLAGAGAYTLLREPRHVCSSSPTRSNGSVFLLGASSALVVSPCCTPIVIGFGAISASMSSFAFVATVVAFALGHAAPLGLLFIGSEAIRKVTSRYGAAVTTVNAGLLIALGAYYGLLA